MTCDPSLWGFRDPITMWGDPITEHVGRSDHLLTIQADHHAVLPRARGDERDRVRAVGAVRHDHLYGARPVGARGDGGTSRGEIIRPTVASLHLWGEARAPW